MQSRSDVLHVVSLFALLFAPTHFRALAVQPHQHKNPALAGLSHEADDGPRTRDLRLGKPTLYQLSYVRAVAEFISDQRGCPGLRTRFMGVKRMVSPLPLAVGLAVIALVALLIYGVNSAGPSRTL